MNVLEKILEEIDKKADYYETDEQSREHVRMVDIIDVEEIIRSNMKEVDDDWIPVEEGLPEEPKFMEEDSYIVQTGNIITPFSAYWDGKEWTDVNDDPVEGVIAWQPLPEPYRPKVKTKES